MKLLKQLIPREKADRFGVGATLFLLSLVVINGFIKLSKIYQEYPTYSLVTFLVAFYALFNVLGNMYKAIVTDTTIFSLENLPVTLLVDWRYCSACEQNAPPRAYHCFTCDKCVLKRHNHCLFLGKCAGHKNFRHYLMFIFYVWVGSVVSNMLNFDFFQKLLSEFSFQTLVILFVPWLAACLGMVSIADMFIVFANSLAFIMFFLMSLYFYVNFSMAMRGQTWHEKAKNITLYRLNWKQNFLEIFGYRWYLAVLWPFASSRLPSDGTQFKKNSASQNNEVTSATTDAYYNYGYNQDSASHVLRRKF